MRYAKAALFGFLAAIALGSACGALDGLRLLPPEHKATIYAAMISCAMNETALLTIIFIPAALLAGWFVGRIRRGR